MSSIWQIKKHQVIYRVSFLFDKLGRRPQQRTSRGCSRRGAMSSRSSTSSSRRRSRSTASATRRGSTPSRNATVPFEVETALQQTRGSRTSRRLGEAQHRPAPRNVWDGRRMEIGRDQAEAPVFAGFFAVLAVSNGTASRQILGDSGTWSRLSENLSRNIIP